MINFCSDYGKFDANSGIYKMAVKHVIDVFCRVDS